VADPISFGKLISERSSWLRVKYRYERQVSSGQLSLLVSDRVQIKGRREHWCFGARSLCKDQFRMTACGTD
jgi:hypothetical protein